MFTASVWRSLGRSPADWTALVEAVRAGGDEPEGAPQPRQGRQPRVLARTRLRGGVALGVRHLVGTAVQGLVTGRAEARVHRRVS
ncbi:hypothetical protein [Nonomuraea dietziae]|uniref:hypothetical protein n=1 Tax=Nonomuraea dietziae TaxID=65515 RepID=UPI0031D0CCEC